VCVCVYRGARECACACSPAHAHAHPARVKSHNTHIGPLPPSTYTHTHYTRARNLHPLKRHTHTHKHTHTYLDLAPQVVLATLHGDHLDSRVLQGGDTVHLAGLLHLRTQHATSCSVHITMRVKAPPHSVHSTRVKAVIA